MRSRPITAADFHLFANCPSGNWIENYRLNCPVIRFHQLLVSEIPTIIKSVMKNQAGEIFSLI